jgi:DNA-directed RNA polymerase specialized sigma24 family protein
VSDGSFEAFVAAQSTAQLRTAYLLTGDRHRARDLLQLALIAAHRHWDPTADPADQAASVRREMVIAHTSWRRRLWVGDLLAQSPLLAGVSGLPGFGTPAPVDPGPRDELTTALARLPPRLRAVLVLRHGVGLSQAAAAAALGSPVEDLQIESTQGLDRLREVLDGAAGQGDAALVERLRHDLAQRAAGLPAAPDDLAAHVLDGERSQRGHRIALLALVVVLLAIAVLVAVTL